MFGTVVAIGRFALDTARAARSTVAAIEALPRIADVLTQLRDTAAHVEHLATFATQELPEIVYQLEAIRRQLAEIESLAATSTVTAQEANGLPISSPGSPRTD